MSALVRAQARIKSWRENPAQFVYENFQVEPDKWQLEVLNNLGGGFTPYRRECMKACTGPGKSAVLAWIGWLRLSCYGRKGGLHPKGAALSITRDNLKDNLWPELSKWQGRSEFLTEAFEYTKQQIYANDHPETWFLSARSFSKDADADAIGRALSGLHSPFPFILLDETGDMPLPVGKAAEQIFTGGCEDGLIAGAGNPTSTSGLLYHICTNLREQWHVTTVTADPDDPDRTPRVPVELAAEQIRVNGRENPWVMATILGLFPLTGFNSLLGIDEVETAMKRFYRIDQYNFSAKILGVDVARMGDDRSVIAPRQGLVCFKPKIFRNVNSSQLAGHVAMAEDKWQADGVIVDGTGGYGSGVIDKLNDLGRHAFDCQFAGSPFNPKYANKRAEILYEFAEWIKLGGALPYIPELVAELTTPTFSFQGDKILIEPKDSIKKRLGRSPDLADAYATTFAYPIAPKAKVVAAGIEQHRDGTITGSRQNGDYDPMQGA
jgi:phage terminase large subunit